MGWLEVFKSLIDPAVIYKAGQSVSYRVSAISGILLVMSCYVRVLETQLAGHGHLGAWGATLRSISIWSFVLGGYFMFGALFAGVANDVFHFFAVHVGSADGINNDIDRIGQFITAKQTVENGYSVLSLEYWKTLGDKIASIPGLAFGLTGYLFSSLALFVVDGALRLAHAIVYSAAFILGLIIIPLAVSQKISIFRGWAMLLGFLFLWPVVDSITMGFLAMPVHAATLKMISQSTSTAFLDVVNLSIVATAVQCLAIIFKVAALVITWVLVANYGTAQAAGAPIVTLFQKVARQLPGLRRR